MRSNLMWVMTKKKEAFTKHHKQKTYNTMSPAS